MKNAQKLITEKDKLFSFKKVTEEEVENCLKELKNSSSPGVTEVPTKLFKLTPISVLTKLFNSCIETCKIPCEWKFAEITPLYKNKGVKTDLNNYRGISVLPPISKVFEKLLAKQITQYFNENKLFFEGQHGFRAGHSCETALHELISELNLSRD